MITKLYLRDFQSIKSNIPIEIKPLTILCGPNSAGKSCVYDALVLLKNLFIQKVTDKTQEENIPYRGKEALDSYDLGVEFIFSLPERREENFMLFKSSAPSTTYHYFLRFFKGSCLTL